MIKKQINTWKRIVSRSKSKLVKMITDVNGTFNDDSFSPEIGQILLRWGYKLIESDLL